MRGTHGKVVADTPLIADVASQVLRDGGNAIGAGVAAVFATGVLAHTHHSLGGEVPILVYLAGEGRVACINGIGPAPRAATAAHFTGTFGGIPDEDSLANAPVPGQTDALILGRQHVLRHGEQQHGNPP